MIHLTSPDIGTDYITQGVARDNVPNHPGYPWVSSGDRMMSSARLRRQRVKEGSRLTFNNYCSLVRFRGFRDPCTIPEHLGLTTQFLASSNRNFIFSKSQMIFSIKLHRRVLLKWLCEARWPTNFRWTPVIISCFTEGRLDFQCF